MHRANTQDDEGKILFAQSSRIKKGKTARRDDDSNFNKCNREKERTFLLFLTPFVNAINVELHPRPILVLSFAGYSIFEEEVLDIPGIRFARAERVPLQNNLATTALFCSVSDRHRGRIYKNVIGLRSMQSPSG